MAGLCDWTGAPASEHQTQSPNLLIPVKPDRPPAVLLQALSEVCKMLCACSQTQQKHTWACQLLYSQSHFSGHPPVQLSVHHCCYPSYSVSSATVVFHLLLEDWSIQYRGKNGVRASTLLFFSTHFLQNIHTIKMAQIPVLSSVAGSNWAQVSHRYLMEKKKIMSHLKLLWSGMRLVSPYSSCLQYSCFHLS